MSLTEQIYAQAQLLAGALSEKQQQLLPSLCLAAERSLSARLRPGLTEQDCRADFLASAALYALAALSELEELSEPERLQLGDVTVQRRGGSPASACLRSQAGLIMAPYVLDAFQFRGV